MTILFQFIHPIIIISYALLSLEAYRNALDITVIVNNVVVIMIHSRVFHKILDVTRIRIVDRPSAGRVITKSSWRLITIFRSSWNPYVPKILQQYPL